MDRSEVEMMVNKPCDDVNVFEVDNTLQSEMFKDAYLKRCELFFIIHLIIRKTFYRII